MESNKILLMSDNSSMFEISTLNATYIICKNLETNAEWRNTFTY